ncbi:hypothetical protein BAE44_0003558 [Dichanthelium oligosanthes]|uniref:Uncharacterized protein n=1 Tax=Dichanthelium oligosanthes TaxID=888268 RepID=A0A1E5WDC9_9POAL|nr:hypothetical protein BAE44_0003558 [Dichanthelium oligosanthes]
MLSQLLTPRIRLALEYLYLAGAVALFCLLVVMHTNFVQQVSHGPFSLQLLLVACLAFSIAPAAAAAGAAVSLIWSGYGASRGLLLQQSPGFGFSPLNCILHAKPGCSSEFSGIEFGEAQLVQIKIISGGLWASRGASYIMDLQNLGRSAEKILEVNGDKFNILASKFWSTWVGPGARRSVPDLKAAGEGPVHHPLSAKESFKAAVTYLFRKWYFRAVSFWRNIKQLSENTLQIMVRSNWNDFLHIIKDLQLPSMDHLLSTIVQWFERRSKAFEPTYLYGVEKGYFLLSEAAKIRHGVRTINITISARNPCFGNRWQQLLINSIVGYDTILTNSLVNSPGHGYLYNFQTKELYDLSYGHEPPEGPTRFGDYFVTKCGVLLMSLFVFFTTTMSVSFTLRETQSRMLRFTGFSYLAFSATAAFMQHLILYFWNRFEVPALQRFIRSRAHIHQQTGVQITSSTIYTSTLHIARVNVRDPGTINDGLGAVREADALLVQDESTRNQQEGQQNGIAEPAANNALQFQEQNPQQAGNAPAGSGSLNPFGSLLLWLLGGGASDGIVSFFSMFRDVRDHGQDYTDPPRNENDQVT